MPASADTVAWIAVGGTAIGAITGATAGGIVDAALENRRERRRARVGARMVRVDLAMAASRLKSIEDTATWWSFQKLGMKAWGLYEDALTARLDDDSLHSVTQSVVSLRTLSDGMRGRFSGTGLAVVPQESVDVSDSVETIRKLRAEATAAYNALAKLADERKVQGLLHD